MSIFDIFLLSFIEGVTEFLPVSSTGHLIIAGHFLGLEGEDISSFEIIIQSGAILAVVVLYFGRFLRLFPTSLKVAEGFQGIRGLIVLGIASSPAFLIGALAGSKIKELLFSPYTVAVALILGGIVLILADREQKVIKVKSLDEIGYLDAFIIGCVQLLAFIPGTSRSAATIVGGLFRGFSRKVATEFSFFLAVPVLLAAAGYELLKGDVFKSTLGIDAVLIGLVLSFIFALFAIKGFIFLLEKYSLRPFGYYRIIFGIFVLVLLN